MDAGHLNRRSEVKEMSWPAVKRNFSQDSFAAYVKTLAWVRWRPSAVVWHNTAAPSLKQWIKTAGEDSAKGLIPGTSRIRNLEMFFRDNNHWSGCPHLFIANDFIWVMNPLTEPGVHSPSWNNIAIGIEMVGDFSSEDDDAGEGLRVKNNTIFATALLCATLGIDPGSKIWLHKQDPKTTHDCPGKDIAQDKEEMIEATRALMGGGEHQPDLVAQVISGGELPKQEVLHKVQTVVNNLSFRSGPGVLNPARSELPKGVILAVLDEAANGATAWLKVQTPAGHIGWVAQRYTEEV